MTNISRDDLKFLRENLEDQKNVSEAFKEWIFSEGQAFFITDNRLSVKALEETAFDLGFTFWEEGKF